jgi:hypothetical protein
MGPSRNNILLFRLPQIPWAVYGDYDASYNPYGLDSYGVSKFSQDGWLNIPYASVLGAKSICRITNLKRRKYMPVLSFRIIKNRCRQAHVVIQSN